MAGGARWSAVEPGRRLLASDVRMKRAAANINAVAPNCIHWLTVLFSSARLRVGAIRQAMIPPITAVSS